MIEGQDAVLLSEEDIKQAISDSVKVDVAFEMAMRAGLDVTLRMSESWSFNVNTYLTSLGSTFSGRTFVFGGAGLMFHWDDIVPAVLPASRRLAKESCEDIEQRFRACPAGKVLSEPPPSPPVQCVEEAKPLAPSVNPRVQDTAPAEPPNTAPAQAPVPDTTLPSGTFPEPPASDPPTPASPAPASPAGTPSDTPATDNLPPSTRFPETDTPAPSPDRNALPSVNAPY